MRSKIAILTLALVLVVPSFALAWSVKGQYEPSTDADADDGFMFTSPPGTATNKVYFNAIMTTHTPAAGVFMSPNAATFETTVNPVSYYAVAVLGEWADCNGDGFIGLGDNGLMEYPASLLPANSHCAAETFGPTPPRGSKPVHNDGLTVREYLPIGWDVNAKSFSNGKDRKDGSIWNIPDKDARVWGDFGLPGAIPGNTCYTLAHPEGTYDSVATMVSHADCFGGGRIQATMLTVTTATGTGPAWEQVRATPHPWGRPGDDSAVHAFECDETFVRVPATSTFWVNVTRPSTPSQGSGTSPAGTVKHIEEGYDDCDTDSHQSIWLSNLPYATESDISNTDGIKRVTGFTMVFNEGVRPSSPNLGAVLGGQPLRDGGLNAVDGEGTWGSTSITTTFNPYVNTLGTRINNVVHATYYAYVSKAQSFGLELPPSTGIYGAEACPVIGVPQTYGRNWACDPNEWWPEGPGVTNQATVEGNVVMIGVRIGQPYQLRDIDCYDLSASPARDNDVHWGVLTGTECA